MTNRIRPIRSYPVKLPRWSLRALLILIAILGLCLGMAAALRARLVAHQAAIEAMDRGHGGYGIERFGPSLYRALVLRLGGNEKMFYDPIRVSLGPVGDSEMEALAKH